MIIKFTKSSIESLPTPDKRTEYQDSKVAGLYLRVTPGGVKTFSVLRRISGKLERITIGQYPAVTVDDARIRAGEINTAIGKGVNPAEIRRGQKAEMTFSGLFAEYLERHSKPRKKTWAEDASKYKQYLERPLGSKKLSAVCRADIARIHSDITKAGHSATANRVLALVSSIYGWSIAVGLYESNPATGIRRNREKSRDRFLQSDELPRFFKALEDEENPIMKDFILISLFTGARRSNVAAMRWLDISFDRAEWRIHETKNGTPQVVTLSPAAIDVLANRKPAKPATFVFPGKGKQGHLVEPKKAWMRLLQRAGLDDLRIHDLRRTLGSWQAKQGASLSVIGRSLNHKSQATTAIYARLDLDPVRESVNTATKAMLIAGRLSSSVES